MWKTLVFLIMLIALLLLLAKGLRGMTKPCAPIVLTDVEVEGLARVVQRVAKPLGFEEARARVL